MRRIVPGQGWLSMYRWQWLYLPVLYGALAFKVRFTDVVETWIKQESGPIRVNFYDSGLVRIIAVKALWAAWRIYWPLAVLRIPHSVFWPLFFATELASGWWLAWNFEVSHLAPDADFPAIMTAEPGAASASAAAAAAAVKFAAAKAARKAGVAGATPPGAPDCEAVKSLATAKAAGDLAAPGARDAVQRVIPASWAVVQAESSVDYGHGSAWTAWWCGALNYQIEHHLFPGISQYHYPDIAPIVKKTCE
jgi:hypothetical protein